MCSRDCAQENNSKSKSLHHYIIVNNPSLKVSFGGDEKPKVTSLGGSSRDVSTTALAPESILLNATLKLPCFTRKER